VWWGVCVELVLAALAGRREPLLEAGPLRAIGEAKALAEGGLMPEGVVLPDIYQLLGVGGVGVQEGSMRRCGVGYGGGDGGNDDTAIVVLSLNGGVPVWDARALWEEGGGAARPEAGSRRTAKCE